ncbi:hypothetical protein CLOHYLEM_07386 [[Clostridium] hylemonae DSM 15053]|uniref:Uncharacterized protein n=1 Tax=[Clostridium] hylemonae DSM 15053 TaxID=553973 RepID=C0C5J9_9FIRM|nr:hypothetical protein CLOHYLEM_07386 [[Clostridium] hylemonae DSM 15053]
MKNKFLRKFPAACAQAVTENYIIVPYLLLQRQLIFTPCKCHLFNHYRGSILVLQDIL